jgi:pseudouridine synthase
MFETSKPVTLLRYLQKQFGISRREYEDMLDDQAIMLNNLPVQKRDTEVKTGEKLTIRLANNEIFEEMVKEIKFRPMIALFYKPKGLVVSKDDPHNPTIFSILPTSRKKDFFPIGRLDKDSEGLLLLANDPTLVDQLAHPSSRLLKIYEVQINTTFKVADIIKAKKGIRVDQNGIQYKKSLDGETRIKAMNSQRGKTGKKSPRPMSRKPDTGPEFPIEKLTIHDGHSHTIKGKSVARIVLEEGKKRHIRRLLKALGYSVLALKRVSFGIYQLGTLKPRAYRLMPYRPHTPKKKKQKFAK